LPAEIQSLAKLDGLYGENIPNAGRSQIHNKDIHITGLIMTAQVLAAQACDPVSTFDLMSRFHLDAEKSLAGIEHEIVSCAIAMGFRNAETFAQYLEHELKFGFFSHQLIFVVCTKMHVHPNRKGAGLEALRLDLILYIQYDIKHGINRTF